MSKFVPGLILFVAFLVGTGIAQAGYIYQFEPASSTITGLNNTTSIDLYLVQNNGDTGLSELGLLSSGVLVTFGPMVALTDGQAASGFDLYVPTKSSNSWDLFLASHSGAAVLGDQQVWLASLTFTWLISGSGTEEIFADDDGSGGTTLGDGSVQIIPEEGNGSIELTPASTAVPEPSTLALLVGLTPEVLVYACWRSRRKRQHGPRPSCSGRLI